MTSHPFHGDLDHLAQDNKLEIIQIQLELYQHKREEAARIVRIFIALFAVLAALSSTDLLDFPNISPSEIINLSGFLGQNLFSMSWMLRINTTIMALFVLMSAAYLIDSMINAFMVLSQEDLYPQNKSKREYDDEFATNEKVIDYWLTENSYIISFATKYLDYCYNYLFWTGLYFLGAFTLAISSIMGLSLIIFATNIVVAYMMYKVVKQSTSNARNYINSKPGVDDNARFWHQIHQAILTLMSTRPPAFNMVLRPLMVPTTILLVVINILLFILYLGQIYFIFIG